MSTIVGSLYMSSSLMPTSCGGGGVRRILQRGHFNVDRVSGECVCGGLGGRWREGGVKGVDFGGEFRAVLHWGGCGFTNWQDN